MNKLRIGISACLLGTKCNYKGGDFNSNLLIKLEESGVLEFVRFCPEDSVFGTPRPNLRIVGGDGFDVLSGTAKVIDENNKDVTELQIKGANQFLDKLKNENINVVVLTDGSPSCGSNVLLTEDNWPAGGFKVGVGVTTALLKNNNISTFSNFDELDIEKYLSDKLENFVPTENLMNLRDMPKFKNLLSN